MNANQNTCKIRWVCLMPIAALVIGLTACDSATDSGTSTREAARVMPTGSATGVLMMNAPISGISYAVSSGASGKTNDEGTFDFTYGDTIEFKIGGLTLGNIPGAEIITPIALADGNENKLQNLLVLLQTLDVDGDLSNGVTISDDTAAALNASINLESSPDTFADAAKLQDVLEASGIEGEIKTPEEAVAQFLSQGFSIFNAHVWAGHDGSTATMLRVATDGSGEYLHGTARPDDSCDENRACGGRTLYQAGAEYGVAKATGVDTRGFEVLGEPIVDSNLREGLSNPMPPRRVRTDGFELIFSDIVNKAIPREQPSVFSEIFHIGGASSTVSAKAGAVVETEVKESRFKRVENEASGIVGAWAYDKDAINTRTLIFFPDGKFFSVDPTGDVQREDQADCARPGVELASYTYNKGANQLSVSGFTYNTDGCVGFSRPDIKEAHKFTINADGESATIEIKGDEPVTAYRISGSTEK